MAGAGGGVTGFGSAAETISRKVGGSGAAPGALPGTAGMVGGGGGGGSISGARTGARAVDRFDVDLGGVPEGISGAVSIGGVGAVERNSSNKTERDASRASGVAGSSWDLVARCGAFAGSGAWSTASRMLCLGLAGSASGLGSSAGSGSGSGALMRAPHLGQLSSMPAMASGTARRALQAGQVNLMRRGFTIPGGGFPKCS